MEIERDDLLIDAGMGTGTWLEQMAATCRVLGLDDHDESLAIAGPRLRAVGGSVLKTSLEQIALPDGCAAAITAMDVLEHLHDDAASLRELVRLLRPGGIAVITVPAMPSLWSDWDESLHHVRRYSRRTLSQLVSNTNTELLRIAYFNTAAVAPAWLVRSWRKWRGPGPVWAEHLIPWPWLNRILEGVMVIPAHWDWFRPPIGLSLIAIIRKNHLPGETVPSSAAARS